jgi:hypothetical protein
MSIQQYRFPIFQPAMRTILDIVTDSENSDYAIITTAIPNQYQVGMIVRLNIPKGYGMEQANQKFAPIVSIDTPYVFTMAIDVTEFEPFVAPTTFPENAQYAQVTPIGEINGILSSATRNVLPYSAT